MELPGSYPVAASKPFLAPSSQVPDPMARYKQLLYYAAKLPPLPAEDHVPSNKVEGCVSQVWASHRSGGRTGQGGRGIHRRLGCTQSPNFLAI